MKRFSIVAAIATFALAFTLVGCGSGQSVDKESLKGFWVLDESAQLGFDAILNLDEDEEEGLVAELMVSDSFLEGTWTTDGSKATITFEDDSSFDVDLGGDADSDASASGDSASGNSASGNSASGAAVDAGSETGSKTGSGRTASIFVTNGKLTLGQADGSRLVFTKSDMDTYYAEQDEGEGGEQVIELDGSDESVEVVDEVIEDVKPVVLADNDTCTITLTGKGTDFTGDPGYRLSVLNKSKKAIYVTSDDVYKVGDKEVEPGLGEVIEAGATMEAFLYFPKDELGGGVEALKNVSGKIIVGDDNSGDEIATMEIKID